MEKIIVIGSSTHAAVVIDAIESAGEFGVLGLVTATPSSEPTLFGHRVLGCDDDLPALLTAHRVRLGVLAIGDNFVRSRVAGRISAACPELGFATVVHPHANVARSARIGPGSVICAGATLVVGAQVGRHCLVNTQASLDHFSVLDDFASLAPRATAGGDVRIGHHTAIGLGANIIHGRVIGAHTVIGAGATVLHDIADHCVAYGTPARVIRSREPGEPYL